jgi:hypothetical protein
MSLKVHAFAIAAIVSVLAGGVTVLAQSLGDVGRDEEARRKEVKHPSKVYTNKDLGSVPAAATEAAKPSTLPSTPATEEKADSKGAGKDVKESDSGISDSKDPGSSDSKDKTKDQAYWSGRMKGLVTQLERDQAFAEALQSRINALTADFSARDDPAQRAAIGRDRQKALDELARLKTTIETDKKAVADLQEEARRAGVPPGWLR